VLLNRGDLVAIGDAEEISEKYMALNEVSEEAA
jgi:hypothetical protein